MLIGYARVSTTSGQTLDLQKDALSGSGVQAGLHRHSQRCNGSPARPCRSTGLLA